VDVGEGEAHQPAPCAPGAEQPDAGQFRQTVVGEPRERRVVRRDRLAAGRLKVVASRREADRPRDVRRACLVPLGGRFPARLGETRLRHHPAAGLVRLQPVEQRAPTVQDADPGRATHLVA
jgi:hypothetical protein